MQNPGPNSSDRVRRNFTLLSTALKQLPRLRKVSIGYSKSSRAARDEDTGQFSGLWEDISTGVSTEFLSPYEHVFKVLLKALSTTTVSLTSLSLGGLPNSPILDGPYSLFSFPQLELEL